MKLRTLAVIASGLLFGAVTEPSSAALLSYWNFNNDNPTYAASTLGSFSTTAASYGEQYTANKLYSNTANGTVFNSSSVYIDFANLSAGVNNAIINGYVAGSTTVHAQTNTTFGGFGVFSDTTGNRVAGDTTTGGSFIIMNPSSAGVGAESGHYITMALSSDGFEGLQLSYDTRTSSGFQLSEVWTYSTNGTDFFSLTTLVVNSAGAFQTKSFSLPTELDDQGTFYLRMTLSGNSGSMAFDNIQLTGTEIVPEPSQYALLAAGLITLFCLRRRKLAT